MLISDYSREMINFDDAQFAISIALAQLNEQVASVAVGRFMGTYLNNESSAESLKLKQKRMLVEEELLRAGTGMVQAVIDYLNKPNALTVTMIGTNKVQARRSLSELITKCTLREIYEQTMRILSKYHPKELIVLYMDTPEYVKTFSDDLRKRMLKSADGYRRNYLDDQIIAEVLQDFKTWVKYNSANGAYSASTCAPIAFLRYAFSTMYSVNDATNFYSILNKSGLNAGLGDESLGATALTFIGLDGKQTSVALDFIDVANKINRASKLLFNHNGSSISFYDIFSCYRDKVLQDRLAQCKKDLQRAVKGCVFEIVDSANDSEAGHLGAVKNKKAGRIKLCRVFESIITDGISQKDVNGLYKKALACTDSLTTKDGVRLFSTKLHATKHYETNSEMMQIIVSGYLAMRDLLRYLESDNSVSSVYNFPTIIFRDAKYLRRFQTIEEYVSYVKDVSTLVVEVENTPGRNDPIVDEFYSNDQVWAYLGTCNLTNDTIYKKLMNTPLGYIRNAVMDSHVISKDKVLLQCIRDNFNLYSQMKNSIISNTSKDAGYAGTLTQLEKIMEWICSTTFSSLEDSKKYALCILFMQEFEKLSKLEGNPVCDAKGNFLFCEENFMQEMMSALRKANAVFGSNPVVWERIQKSYKHRIVAMSKCVAFIGNQEKVNLECSFEEVRNTLAFCTMLSTMIEQYCTKLDTLKNYNEKWLYLLLADIAESPELFKIPANSTSCEDFSFLFNGGAASYALSGEYSIADILEINGRRNAFLVHALNLFFARCDTGQENFATAFELLDKYISDRYSPVVVESLDNKILENASVAIGSLITGEEDSSIRMILEGMLQFDDLGYAIMGGERLTINGLYILRYGYFIKLNTFVKNFICEPITKEHLIHIKMLVTGALSR